MVAAICDEANVSLRRVARGWVGLGAAEIGRLRLIPRERISQLWEFAPRVLGPKRDARERVS